MPLFRLLRPWLLTSVPLLALLFGLGLAFEFDEYQVFLFFRQHRAVYPELASLLKFVTDWANPAFYAFFLSLLWRAWRDKRPGLKRFVLVYILVQIVISLLAVRGIKSIIGRPRPGEDPFFQPMTNRPSYHSLPSGHTTEAATSSLALALRYRSCLLSLGLGILLALLGFTRIYLGWHHPTDVLFGWLLGSVAGLAIQLLTSKD
ncbi:MAG: phosphatase PAP2 family protein [Desulfovibrionaceae bacterium]